MDAARGEGDGIGYASRKKERLVKKRFVLENRKGKKEKHDMHTRSRDQKHVEPPLPCRQG
jgi:hypothetical protein